ncbi:uroporphyrinogen-III synthase [Rhizobium sp. CG5]|uniref:uroporphyrinogen-III synthase n=1 Tax=Rhizobium sp. CG5 TaxID=2726076 RepID=UPI00203344DD|nr:uroporphyrinogen-III synthase [Rhizobium sp. CG5]MCM2475306.1 uroporphyrinogen-III synthase [Rhizobium sp. CG5]
MRILVTRPEQSGQKTAHMLETLGHQPVLLPLAAPYHHPDAILDALARHEGPLAVTSAVAIYGLAKLGDRLLPYLDWPLYAVGPATAKAAEQAGFRQVVASSGDGGALADTIASHHAAVPILYLAGHPRAKTFEQRLSERQIPFTVCESYAMQALIPDRETLHRLLVDSPVDTVLLYSTETARRFFDLPIFAERPDLLSSLPILCLSAAIAATVPPQYRRHAQAARSADEASLLALLPRS